MSYSWKDFFWLVVVSVGVYVLFFREQLDPPKPLPNPKPMPVLPGPDPWPMPSPQPEPRPGPI